MNIFKDDNGKLDRAFIRFFLTMIIVTVIAVFTFNIDYNQGTSNEPTIKRGQVTLVIKHFYSIERGDFVVFSKDNVSNGDRLNKRIVAIGGDHVEIKDGKLYVNGKEDTLFPNIKYDDYVDIVVPENCYYVMGDNRNDSLDSRDFGVVMEDEIKGKVIWY